MPSKRPLTRELLIAASFCTAGVLAGLFWSGRNDAASELVAANGEPARPRERLVSATELASAMGRIERRLDSLDSSTASARDEASASSRAGASAVGSAPASNERPPNEPRTEAAQEALDEGLEIIEAASQRKEWTAEDGRALLNLAGELNAFDAEELFRTLAVTVNRTQMKIAGTLF